MSRLALNISGQARYIRTAYPYIKSNIIDSNENVDVFIHCWLGNPGEKYDSGGWIDTDIIEDNLVESIQDLYKPQRWIFEPQRYDLLPRSVEEYSTKNTTDAPVFNQFSMFYSRYQANQLKRLHELYRGFTYDGVFHTRFDCAPLNPIVYQENNSINSCDICRNPEVISDYLLWGSSQNMDKIGNIYTEMDRFWNEKNVLMCGENMLMASIEENSLKTEKHKIGCFLVRDDKFINREFGKEWQK